MKNILIVFAAFLFYGFSSGSNDNTYEGIAIDNKSLEFIYKEIHKELFEEGKHIRTITSFVCDENNEFAKRELDFRNSFQKPTYRLTDNRSGLLEEVTYRGNNQFDIRYKKNKKSKLKEKSLFVPEPAIVDGGFNYFIKENWDQILSEQKLDFNFLSVAFQDYFSFRIYRVKEKEQNDKMVVLKMESQSALLRVLMNPIYISYDSDTRRILKYEGISNIRNPKGSSYKALLQYPELGP
ncbi:hypothetical protein [Marinifilum caeruleilacunae]|uniref:Outer membrane lipoprotein-sorting protein n=1 Tax=Marinifilum caeruleilacunae TaxID=2499076 RepID=A0ABX1WYI6_9BACT|nr:hypothetical protein [Marinifilum caeruleilacunae]NOU61184.1 hypothetical protein [Marinifilum caeruleilacunae]